MKSIVRFFEQGNVLPAALLTSAFIGLLTFLGIVFVPKVVSPVAEMRIEPLEQTVEVGDTFVVDLIVESSEPVNVFGGELSFNNEVLKVDSIDYNVSIADLWAELPWYSNGDGTLNFGGGTTKQGGFVGMGSLIRVTFKTLVEGEGEIALKNPRVLLHDGMGTDATLETSIDAIVVVEDTLVDESNLIKQQPIGASYRVVIMPPSTDLNKDGRQTIADVSILMLHLTSEDAQYDFNLDGEVNIRDLSIMLNTK